ncbi:MAG: radical SAM protein [Kiritimatiellae bacterium]|nr:radical SAM protein [Kiritimatiellia bacterium]
MPAKPAKQQLAPTVFFKKVCGEVYVRNVATGEEFLFNAAAAPVFAALRRGAARDAPALRGNAAFLRQLKSFGLLRAHTGGVRSRVTAVQKSDTTATDVPTDIAGHCQEVCRQRRRLWSAGLELTWRCNARCRHCYLDIPEEQTAIDELSVAEWLSVIDQLSRMGCMNVLVTGGEPTLHSAFLPVCERIVNRGMLCDIYTNGIDIPDAMFGALCKLPFNSVSVSLYSGTDAFHDEVTGIPGSFRRTLDTILRFKEAGAAVYAKAPMFHGHLDDFFAAKELGERLGFSVTPSNILVPGHSGSSRNGLMLDAGEYRSFLERETTPDAGEDIASARERRASEPICQAGLTTLCVSPAGEVRPCNSFSAVCGNVREAPLSQIWRTVDIFRRLRSLRRRDVSPRCSQCKDIAYCTVCPGASWSESGGTSISPSSWSCEQAAVRASFNRKS